MGGDSIIGWNLDLPRVVASLHANLSESNPRMEFIMIASRPLNDMGTLLTNLLRKT